MRGFRGFVTVGYSWSVSVCSFEGGTKSHKFPGFACIALEAFGATKFLSWFWARTALRCIEVGLDGKLLDGMKWIAGPFLYFSWVFPKHTYKLGSTFFFLGASVLQPEGSSIPQLWFWSVFHLTTTPKCKNMENLPFVDCRPFLLWNFPNHCQVSPMSMQHSFFFPRGFPVCSRCAKDGKGALWTYVIHNIYDIYDILWHGITWIYVCVSYQCLFMFGYVWLVGGIVPI